MDGRLGHLAIETILRPLIEGPALPTARTRALVLIKAAIQQEELDGRQCTMLLQGLDLLARLDVTAVWHILAPASADPLDATVNADTWMRLSASGVSLPGVGEIAWYEHAARRLRGLRRRALQHELTSLDESLDLERFRQVAVVPLLERTWLPRLVYEPADETTDDLPGHILKAADAADMSRRVLAGIAVAATWQERLRAYLEALHETRMPVAVASANYLAHGLAAWNVDGEHLAVETPALGVPLKAGWPLGHVFDLIVLPAEVDGADPIPATYWNAESLDQAHRAVDDYFRRSSPALPAVQPRAYGTAALPGDYTGGWQSPRPIHIDGPSATLPLAAALIARIGGLGRVEGAMATAALGDGGAVRPLAGREWLRQKGRIAGLLFALTEQQRLVDGCATVYAAAANVDDLREGAHGVGVDLAVEAIASLDELEGRLMVDPYESLLTSYIADGDKALAELRTLMRSPSES